MKPRVIALLSLGLVLLLATVIWLFLIASNHSHDDAQRLSTKAQHEPKNQENSKEQNNNTQTKSPFRHDNQEKSSQKQKKQPLEEKNETQETPLEAPEKKQTRSSTIFDIFSSDSQEPEPDAPNKRSSEESSYLAKQARRGSRLHQTRHGHITPKLTRLKNQDKRLSLNSNAQKDFLPGLYGKHYIFSEDDYENFLWGDNHLFKEELIKIRRVDETIAFKNRESFRLFDNGAYPPYRTDNFGARWDGYLLIEEKQELIIGLGSDSVGALAIDGQVIIANTTPLWYEELYARVELEAGYHELTIEYVEVFQGDDPEKNAACMLFWKKDWGSAAEVLPGDWLFYNPKSSTSTPPIIEYVEPSAAEVGEEIRIYGKHFSNPAPASLLKKSSSAEAPAALEHTIYIDGILALPQEFKPRSVLSASGEMLDVFVVKVPAGAGSGMVRIEGSDTRDSSNEVFLEVTTTFGAVISVWDLSGYAFDFPAPSSRTPDSAFFEEVPFPFNLDKLDQAYQNIPIALRIEGKVAGAESGDDNSALNKHISFKLLYRSVALRFTINDNLILEESDINSHEKTHNGLSRGESIWRPYTVEILIDPEKSGRDLNVTFQPNFPGSNYANDDTGSRYSAFRPGFELPEAPEILWPLETKDPAAGVGEELTLFAYFPETTEEKTAGIKNEPRFFIDNTAVKSFRRLPDPPLHHEEKSFKKYSLTVPDHVGHGKLQARFGLVQSEPLFFNVSNRGLTGLYYDFNNPLDQIPDVESLSPDMRRLDKHLEFHNNTDFQLPFLPERFSVEWYGSLRIPENGEWTFIIQSDDGVRLTLDDQVVVDYPFRRSPRETQKKISLSAGWHDLKIEFFENDVIEKCVVWWIPPEESEREHIPLKHLSTERTRGVPDKFPTEN